MFELFRSGEMKLEDVRGLRFSFQLLNRNVMRSVWAKCLNQFPDGLNGVSPGQSRILHIFLCLLRTPIPSQYPLVRTAS
jgi:hypothetical protein